jgi:hypothetical protein
MFSTRFLHPHRTNLVLLPAIWHRSSAAWLQVLTHSSSSFRSQAMHPPPPAPRPPPERDWRGRKTMEETMRVLSIGELMRLTRTELYDLLARIMNILADFLEDSSDRQAAEINLRNIRTVLAWRDFSP